MEQNKFVPDKKNNEAGYVLVGALLILVLLVVIGIAATTSTVLELQISGSDRTHKETFYAADGGTEVGSQLVEENISCPGGFTANAVPNALLNGNVFVPSGKLQFWDNVPVDLDAATAVTTDDFSPANRDAYYPAASNGNTPPYTDIQTGGVYEPNVGGALQQLAGYEGKGKGAAGGGGSRLYNIHSRSYGANNSESWLTVEWRHVIGQEGACNY